MNNEKLAIKVRTSMSNRCFKEGYVAVVDVLMDCGVLTKENYQLWRKGKIDYLERACHTNLSKLSFILLQMKQYAHEKSLKPSICFYKQYGCKSVRPLRFTKSGAKELENKYSTHYVDVERCKEIKERRNQQ